MINYFIIILVCLSLFYSAFLIWCLAGWKRLKNPVPASAGFTTPVSVIIPARDEEKNIATCLHEILKQNYPAELIEIIVVNDQSSDRTAVYVRNIIELHLGRKIILLSNETSERPHKKQALTAGIRMAGGELIVTTDADCSRSANWIAALVNCYEQDHPELIAGPVCFEKEKNIFEKMQSLEFMGLIGIGAGAISNHSPVMCNGANLAYTKKIFYEVDGFSGQPGIASGDDTQLLLKIAKINA